MLFNSVPFLAFVAAFFALWPFFRGRHNLRWGYLVAASFVFYGWWDWRYLLLLIGSGLIDYAAALAMQRWPYLRRLLLVASLAANLGSLGLFKYLDFCIENANEMARLAGWNAEWPLLHLTLPVGISFYTFQSMSYTIDVYRGQLTPTRNVLHFFAYLSIFPQLVAGPIVRATQLLPQLESQTPPTAEQRWEGLRLIVHGYFKKMVVADALAPVVDSAFSATAPAPSCPFWWVVMVMFALQIYCDFSGYSDIARGLGRWMGYDFPLNFNHPYTAVGFRDFWARWHISLSTWFRDYLYLPLGGSRGGPWRTHFNLWLTMLVSGLWHGAGWPFVLWGALHAAYLSLERVTQWPQRLCDAGMRLPATLLTMALTLLAWVFFRSNSVTQAVAVMKILFDPSLSSLQPLMWLGPTNMLLVTVMFLRELYFWLGLDRTPLPTARWHVALQPLSVALMIVACVLLRGPGQAFVYFQF